MTAPTVEERLYVLLQRALDDDGIEGDNAWHMFAARAKGQKGKIFFLTKDYVNPLMSIVEDQDARIAELEARNALLERTINEHGIAPKKQKTQSFPWDQYPELEERAFQMRFFEKRSAADTVAMIVAKAPEAEGNTTFLNQRFIQGRPSKHFNIEVKPADSSEPTNWAELWKIGTLEHAADWMKRVMYLSNCWDKFQRDGDVPKDWNTKDPNKYISAKKLKNLRHLYHTNGFLPAAKELETAVEVAGINGISRTNLNRQGVSTRRFDIEKQSIIFQIEKDVFVHYSFAHYYPNLAAAQVAALKYQQLHGKEIDVPLKAVS